MRDWSIRTPALMLSLLAAACGQVASGPDGGDGDAGPATDGGQDPPDYAALFPSDRLVDVDLTMSDESWNTLMADPVADVYVPATLTYDGVVLEVAVRLKGNSSRRSVMMMGSQRYSFKVDIDYYVPGQELHGVDKINLNNGFKDPTDMRERLATDLYRDFGLPTIRTAHARLSRNGRYFGLYTVVEQVDKEFLRTWFADDGGDLFKPEMPDGNLTWKGDALTDYPNIGLETNQDVADHPALIALIDLLANGDAAALESQLPAMLDVDRLLRYLAVTVVLSSLDSYLGMGHNYYLYQDPSDGRFTLLPWDTNEAYGNFWCMGMDVTSLVDLDPSQPVCGDPTGKPLASRVLAVPAWLATYQGYLDQLISGDQAPDAVYARVHAMADLIRDAATSDPTAFFPASDFESNLDSDVGRSLGLTSFAERRATALRARLP